MKTLFITSSFNFYYKDENKVKHPRRIGNENGFLDSLQKELVKRDLCVIISGKPKLERTLDPTDIYKKGLMMSDIAFKEYIYVDDTNKQNIKEYIEKADCIDLCGGHLPTCNDFINELNLRELIKDFNGVIIGASGGGMNMADTVYCIPEIEGEHTDQNFNRYLRGLGLTDIHTIPHYQYFKTMSFKDGVKMVEDILIPDSYKMDMIAIPDGSYIVQKGNDIVIYGEAYLFSKGKISRICENDKSIKNNSYIK